MAVPKIVLAAPLARWLPNHKSGEQSVRVTGLTVREAIDEMLRSHPTLRGYLLDDQGTLRHHVAAFVNGVVVCDKLRLSEPVAPDGEIFLAQALSGG